MSEVFCEDACKDSSSKIWVKIRAGNASMYFYLNSEGKVCEDYSARSQKDITSGFKNKAWKIASETLKKIKEKREQQVPV